MLTFFLKDLEFLHTDTENCLKTTCWLLPLGNLWYLLLRKCDFTVHFLHLLLGVHFQPTTIRCGGVAQWLGRRISDQGVPGSNPGRCTFRCGLEQVIFTLLSTG